MMATAYELRMHLQRAHGVRLAGLDYGSLLTIHDVEHRPGIGQDHEHDDGPSPGRWMRDCADFGCGEGSALMGDEAARSADTVVTPVEENGR